MRKLHKITMGLAGVWMCTAAPLKARQDMSDVEIRTVSVAEGIYMLVGQGGNIGLSVGENGPFVVDDQYAPLTEKILAAIAEVSDGEVRFVLNTHWHFDHTGGNENFGEAGAFIVAHENVRRRMSVDQFMEAFDRAVPAAPPIALPIITFTEGVTFRWNGETIRVVHVENAHTDGDAIVMFENANVVHMGDTFFRDRFPFIDTATGGSIDGMIAASGTALAVMDGETQVIPGHGALSNREDLRRYRDALKTMRDAVAELMGRGRSLEQIVAARPIRAQAEAWGQNEAAEASFVATIHYGLVA